MKCTLFGNFCSCFEGSPISNIAKTTSKPFLRKIVFNVLLRCKVHRRMPSLTWCSSSADAVPQFLELLAIHHTQVLPAQNLWHKTNNFLHRARFVPIPSSSLLACTNTVLCAHIYFLIPFFASHRMIMIWYHQYRIIFPFP